MFVELNSEIFLSIADTFQHGHWNLELVSTIGADADGGNGAEPLDHSETTFRHMLVLRSRLRSFAHHFRLKRELCFDALDELLNFIIFAGPRGSLLAGLVVCHATSLPQVCRIWLPVEFKRHQYPPAAASYIYVSYIYVLKLNDNVPSRTI